MSRPGREVELTAIAAPDRPGETEMAHDTPLSPFEIWGRTLRNRVVSTAHGEQRAAGGALTEHHLDY